MSETKIIMFDSPEAAQFKTVEGWVSGDGRFYGSDERSARWAGCTHEVCECGNVHEKGRTICNVCHAKRRREKYLAMPMVEWDGSIPICTFDDDKFFFDDSSFIDWLGEQLFEAEEAGELEPIIEIVLCTPQHLHEIDDDTWADELPDNDHGGDGLPAEVQEAVDALNEVIRKAGPVSWWASDTRINVEPYLVQARVDLAKDREKSNVGNDRLT